MDSQPKADRRAVLLTSGRDPAGDLEAADVRFVTVSSPYEAAAELLAEPTNALVVDLKLIEGRHCGLLGIAHQANAETFAVGAIPPGLTGEQLSGLRLISRSALPAALAGLIPKGSGHAASAIEQDERKDNLKLEGDAPTSYSAKPPGGKATKVGDILTNEELSALLEDEL